MEIRNVPVLTGLRGLAAYVVLIGHTVDFTWGGTYHSIVLGPVLFGMSLFFILSGVVIALNYSHSIGTLVGKWNFFVARLARLLPLYLAMLLVAYHYDPAFVGRVSEDPGGTLPVILSMTQSWFNLHGLPGSLFGQSWSISTEWGFYALFIVGAPFLIAIGNPKRALPVFLLSTFLTLWVLFALRPEFEHLLSGLAPDEAMRQGISAPPWLWLTYFGPLRVLEFVAGVLLCRVYLEDPSLWADRAGTVLSCAGLWIAACFVLAASAGSANSPTEDMLRSFGFAPAIVSALLALCTSETWLSRRFSGSIMTFLGEISYSVYALQFFLLWLLKKAGYHAVTGTRYDALIFAVIVILFTTVASVATYNFIERPARRVIRRALMISREKAAPTIA